MVFDARQKPAEDGGQGKCDEWNGEGGDDGPEQKSVPLPEPELVSEVEGMLAGGVEKFVCGERHRRGVEDSAGGVDEWDDQDEFERIDDVVADLTCGHIEAKDKGYGKTEEGGASKDGVDADEKAGGNAPGQLFRRGSHAEQCEDGKGDAAIDPVVVDGIGALAGFAAICFVGLHF